MTDSAPLNVSCCPESFHPVMQELSVRNFIVQTEALHLSEVDARSFIELHWAFSSACIGLHCKESRTRAALENDEASSLALTRCVMELALCEASERRDLEKMFFETAATSGECLALTITCFRLREKIAQQECVDYRAFLARFHSATPLPPEVAILVNILDTQEAGLRADLELEEMEVATVLCESHHLVLQESFMRESIRRSAVEQFSSIGMQAQEAIQRGSIMAMERAGINMIRACGMDLLQLQSVEISQRAGLELLEDISVLHLTDFHQFIAHGIEVAQACDMAEDTVKFLKQEILSRAQAEIEESSDRHEIADLLIPYCEPSSSSSASSISAASSSGYPDDAFFSNIAGGNSSTGMTIDNVSDASPASKSALVSDAQSPERRLTGSRCTLSDNADGWSRLRHDVLTARTVWQQPGSDLKLRRTPPPAPLDQVQDGPAPVFVDSNADVFLSMSRRRAQTLPSPTGTKRLSVRQIVNKKRQSGGGGAGKRAKKLPPVEKVEHRESLAIELLSPTGV
eukprot:NODE_649_length_2015_cov_17.120549_g600_i0.p1 GENE.NODE_649_length_2015_cov_17.120549_g600_i0~~NODE_649_length_2015_cov_17.120549_g600_i0.p1  ORF type:complete len:587 (+),score=105.17 NODE_649_length_2015_cov_17.120549_g600_i0:215-1762(+)